MLSRCGTVFFLLLCATTVAVADGPADNVTDNVRRIPALGIEVPAVSGSGLPRHNVWAEPWEEACKGLFRSGAVYAA